VAVKFHKNGEVVYKLTWLYKMLLCGELCLCLILG